VPLFQTSRDGFEDAWAVLDVAGAPQRAGRQTKAIATSRWPRVPYEYGQISWAPWTSACATSGSIPRRCTSSRARRKNSPRSRQRSTSASMPPGRRSAGRPGMRRSLKLTFVVASSPDRRADARDRGRSNVGPRRVLVYQTTVNGAGSGRSDTRCDPRSGHYWQPSRRRRS